MSLQDRVADIVRQCRGPSPDEAAEIEKLLEQGANSAIDDGFNIGVRDLLVRKGGLSRLEAETLVAAGDALGVDLGRAPEDVRNAISKSMALPHLPPSQPGSAQVQPRQVPAKANGCVTAFTTVVIVGACILFAMPLLLGKLGSSPGPDSTKPDQQVHYISPDPAGWDYRHETDEISDKRAAIALATSLNEVDFAFPYQGRQRMKLWVIKHPRYGTQVRLQIDQGQFDVGYDKPQIVAAFDGKVHTFAANEPADHSTTDIFIRDADGFISRLKKASDLKIEATFYQQGSVTFRFDVKNLKWPPPGD